MSRRWVLSHGTSEVRTHTTFPTFQSPSSRVLHPGFLFRFGERNQFENWSKFPGTRETTSWQGLHLGVVEMLCKPCWCELSVCVVMLTIMMFVGTHVHTHHLRRSLRALTWCRTVDWKVRSSKVSLTFLSFPKKCVEIIPFKGFERSSQYQNFHHFLYTLGLSRFSSE